MQYKKWELVLSLVLLAMVSMLTEKTKLLETTVPAKQENIIVLDAGHGGMDSGKVGINNALEKEINLKIVYFLKTALEEQGLTVVLTRQDDDGLYQATDSNKKLADMKERCKIIENSNCVMTVSIHQNSYHEGSVAGPQVFYYVTSVKGKQIAESIQKQLIAELKPKKEREAKSNDTYYLLKNVACPIVIVECGFLSNWEEAQLLCTEDYQKRVALAVQKGIVDYLTQESS